MRFSTTSSELQKVLGVLGGVIPAKSTLPVLENFLFELSKEKLRITATDLEISMTVEIPVKGGKEGRIAIPAKRLSETVRALPSTNVEFIAEPENNRVLMRTENGEYKLTGESSENYPQIPSVKGNTQLDVSDETMNRLISKTSFAVSSDELRPAMMGILFQIKKNEIRAVATDGHRLVRIVNANFSTKNPDQEIIIPAKALNLVSKSSAGSSKSSISYNDNHVMFTFDGTTLISRIIEEKYPNYESVIPLDNEKTLTVNRNQLISSVKRTSLYASSTTHQVRFSLKKNTLVVSAEDIDFGSEARETLSCEYSGEAMDIGFNSSYINDILSHIDTDEVLMLFSSPTRAAIVKPVIQKDGENLLTLVMPVRLSA